jgi:hypothetical protein
MRVYRSGLKIYIGEQENKKTENKKNNTLINLEHISFTPCIKKPILPPYYFFEITVRKSLTFWLGKNNQ